MIPARSQPGQRDFACLLVDDNQIVLDALGDLLDSEGIEVAGRLRSGIEALRLLERSPVTAIVLDERLPDLSGLEVAQRAVEIIRKRTPIIMYTSCADSKLVRDAFDAGARAVVVKEASPSNLLEAIAVVVAGGTYLDPSLRHGAHGLT